MATKQRGRPLGLLLNPDAAKHCLGGRPQSWLAVEAGISTAHLSEVLSGSKGVTPETAQRLADALSVPAGLLFPQLVQFSTAVRHFTAPKNEDAVA